MKKTGLPHVTLHALGHSKTSTTMDLYCHANEEGKRRAVNRLDGLINI